MKPFEKYFEKVKIRDAERKKEGIISATVRSITMYEYTPTEQAEIVNQILLRVFDKTKEGRSKHIEQAREYQSAIKEFNLK